MGPTYNIIVAQKSRFKQILPGGTSQNGHHFISNKYGNAELHKYAHKYELLEIVGLKEPSGVSKSELEVILGLMPEDAKFVCGLPKATTYDITTSLGTPENPFPEFPGRSSTERESTPKKMELTHNKVKTFFFKFNFHYREIY